MADINDDEIDMTDFTLNGNTSAKSSLGSTDRKEEPVAQTVEAKNVEPNKQPVNYDDEIPMSQDEKFKSGTTSASEDLKNPNNDVPVVESSPVEPTPPPIKEEPTPIVEPTPPKVEEPTPVVEPTPPPIKEEPTPIVEPTPPKVEEPTNNPVEEEIEIPDSEKFKTGGTDKKEHLPNDKKEEEDVPEDIPEDIPVEEASKVTKEVKIEEQIKRDISAVAAMDAVTRATLGAAENGFNVSGVGGFGNHEQKSNVVGVGASYKTDFGDKNSIAAAVTGTHVKNKLSEGVGIGLATAVNRQFTEKFDAGIQANLSRHNKASEHEANKSIGVGVRAGYQVHENTKIMGHAGVSNFKFKDGERVTGSTFGVGINQKLSDNWKAFAALDYNKGNFNKNNGGRNHSVSGAIGLNYSEQTTKGQKELPKIAVKPIENVDQARKIEEEKQLIKLSADNYFEHDKAVIKADSEQTIMNFYNNLNMKGSNGLSIVENALKNNQKIIIGGSTDPMGSDKYNQVLSEQRANAVKDKLIEINPKLKDLIVVKGYGEHSPYQKFTNDDINKMDKMGISRKEKIATIASDRSVIAMLTGTNEINNNELNKHMMAMDKNKNMLINDNGVINVVSSDRDSLKMNQINQMNQNTMLASSNVNSNMGSKYDSVSITETRAKIVDGKEVDYAKFHNGKEVSIDGSANVASNNQGEKLNVEAVTLDGVKNLIAGAGSGLNKVVDEAREMVHNATKPSMPS